MDQSTGETGDQKLVHAPGEVEKFYRQFPAGTIIGMEATGNCQWFLELMATLGHEVRIGDAMRPRFEPVTHGNRSTTSEMHSYC